MCLLLHYLYPCKLYYLHPCKTTLIPQLHYLRVLAFLVSVSYALVYLTPHLLWSWSIPKTLFVFAIHLNLAKPITNTL
jgi:hypothetical protein